MAGMALIETAGTLSQEEIESEVGSFGYGDSVVVETYYPSLSNSRLAQSLFAAFGRSVEDLAARDCQ